MSSVYLRRYTNLPALIYLLREQKLTLLDPTSWDDQNDSYYLALYRERTKLLSVLALCFSKANESYHHWRVFSDGSSGICIRFKRLELLKAVRRHPGVQARAVDYRTLKELQAQRLAVKDLPFVKRQAYEHENEFRIIHESQVRKLRTLDIEIPLSCIERVTLSPWIPYALFTQVKKTLRSIPRCSALSIVRSTLISNEKWKKYGETAA